MRVFINYRRIENSWPAEYIFEKLATVYGKEEVFFDDRQIDAGDDISKEVSEALSMAKVLIVVIGSNWLYMQDCSGRRRIDSENDWVRYEIRTCLGNDNCLVIPVLLDDTVLPLKQYLPPDIRKLADCKAITINQQSKESDISALQNRIATYIQKPSAIDPEIVTNNIVYERLSKHGRLNLSSFQNPYVSQYDPDEWGNQKIGIVVCFPTIAYIKNAPKPSQIPAVALCINQSQTADVELILGKKLYEKFSNLSPSKIFCSDKEEMLRRLAPFFTSNFVAGVTLPALLFTSRVNSRKQKYIYGTVINSLVRPLLEYHNEIDYEINSIEIASIGSNSQTSKLLTVLNGEIDNEVKILTDKDIESLVRLLTWCVGSTINTENKNWIEIIKSG